MKNAHHNWRYAFLTFLILGSCLAGRAQTEVLAQYTELLTQFANSYPIAYTIELRSYAPLDKDQKVDTETLEFLNTGEFQYVRIGDTEMIVGRNRHVTIHHLAQEIIVQSASKRNVGNPLLNASLIESFVRHHGLQGHIIDKGDDEAISIVFQTPDKSNTILELEYDKNNKRILRTKINESGLTSINDSSEPRVTEAIYSNYKIEDLTLAQKFQQLISQDNIGLIGNGQYADYQIIEL